MLNTKSEQKQNKKAKSGNNPKSLTVSTKIVLFCFSVEVILKLKYILSNLT